MVVSPLALHCANATPWRPSRLVRRVHKLVSYLFHYW